MTSRHACACIQLEAGQRLPTPTPPAADVAVVGGRQRVARRSGSSPDLMVCTSSVSSARPAAARGEPVSWSSSLRVSIHALWGGEILRLPEAPRLGPGALLVNLRPKRASETCNEHAASSRCTPGSLAQLLGRCVPRTARLWSRRMATRRSLCRCADGARISQCAGWPAAAWWQLQARMLGPLVRCLEVQGAR